MFCRVWGLFVVNAVRVFGLFLCRVWRNSKEPSKKGGGDRTVLKRGLYFLSPLDTVMKWRQLDRPLETYKRARSGFVAPDAVVHFGLKFEYHTGIISYRKGGETVNDLVTIVIK
ncbi:hypothetical protein BDR07DRAFT_1385257 [Suillus spraguei]|nr:hypothetical protein BDR07DRAFT_1385257 [Suillus spraguei]